MIVLYSHLRAMGFSPAEIADDPFLQKNVDALVEDTERAAGEKQYNGANQGETELDINSNIFAARILELVAFCRKDVPDVQDMNPLLCSVLGRIFLWVDYVSLPQSLFANKRPTRKNGSRHH